MTPSRSLLADTLVTTAITALATFAVPSLMRAARGASIIAPLNAESHVVWGDEAAGHAEASGKYTGVGIATHVGACFWWSAIYEGLMGRVDRRMPAEDIAAAVGTAAGAYVLDYHLLPERLTPGFEMRYSPAEFVAFFVTLAAALPLRRLLSRDTHVIRNWSGTRHAPTAPVFADRRPVPTDA